MPPSRSALFIVACLAAHTAFSGPITAEEIGLMVRMRLPEQEILAEARKRHLMAPIHDASAAQLKTMGASDALLDALRTSVKTLTPEEAAAARAGETRHRAQSERELAELRARMAATHAASETPPDGGFAASLGSHVSRIGETGWGGQDQSDWLGVRYVLLYFSAGWCGPCRQFTPELVAQYPNLKAKFPDLEIVFVSADRTSLDAIKYSINYKMPWYALAHEEAKNRVEQYAARGIPYLALVGPDGVVLRPPGKEKADYIAPGTILQWIASGRWRD